jgi:hypothetical protein
MQKGWRPRGKWYRFLAKDLSFGSSFNTAPCVWAWTCILRKQKDTVGGGGLSAFLGISLGLVETSTDILWASAVLTEDSFLSSSGPGSIWSIPNGNVHSAHCLFSRQCNDFALVWVDFIIPRTSRENLVLRSWPCPWSGNTRSNLCRKSVCSAALHSNHNDLLLY